MTTTAHTNCSHEATPHDRAACRKSRAADLAARQDMIFELLQVFNSDSHSTSDHWVFYAARRFASYEGSNRNAAAEAVLLHFLPSGDDEVDSSRRLNGYTITASIPEMLSITRRASS